MKPAFFLDREEEAPAFEEDAEIDIGTEHQPDMVVEAGFGIGAAPLVHHGFVAGERHDLSEFLQPRQEVADPRLDPDGSQSAFGGDERRLGNAELAREVALTQ